MLPHARLWPHVPDFVSQVAVPSLDRCDQPRREVGGVGFVGGDRELMGPQRVRSATLAPSAHAMAPHGSCG